MLPGTSAESARAIFAYERQPTQTAYHSQPYGYTQRAPIELPPPLELRPTLQTSLSEASGTQRHHHDAFRGPVSTTADYRGQGQSLPGLRDILTAGHHGPAQSTHDRAQWTTNSSGLSRYQPSEGPHSHSEWHPPLALHPPTGPAPAYPSGRRVDLPVLESSPVTRHPPQSLPVSPYTGYPEARDYVDVRAERTRHASATSHLTNGMTSPYAVCSEDAQYRSGGTACDRAANMPIPGVGNEPQRKYLGVKDVPGEGAYHLYEGGYRIPTQVDGEQVNPAWGLTKANKPRKRLALACLDCREKKIKCEPGVSSCLQCEKAKRPCRRAQLHPSQTEGAGTPPAWQNTTSSPVRKNASDLTPQASRGDEMDVANKRRSREDPSPPNVPSKKHRSASPNLADEAATAGLAAVRSTADPVTVQNTAESSYRTLMWEEDPYAVDPDTTTHLLNLYFACVNDASYSLYPRNTFMRWVTLTPDKCQLERMVLYAMLAVGSIFADDHYSGFARQCAQIAKDAISAKLGSFKLPVIHTRLLMAVYHTARGSDEIAWDYTGSAIRACTSSTLQMQTEHGCGEGSESRGYARIEFGLNEEQLIECKRRTFWSCFLMDRYEYGHLCAITLHDIFLRLPCSNDVYEQGLRSEAPSFNNGIIDASETILIPVSPICPMAWVCLLAAVWGDVFTFSHRMTHRSHLTFADAYGNFYAETYNRLQGWSNRLPEYLRYSESNVTRSVREGYAAVFVSTHALYHLLLMRLNRYVRHQCLDPERIKRNIRAAHHHAHAMLGMTNAVLVAAGQSSSANSERIDLVLSTPIIGHAIMAAVDIAGAGGLDSNLKSTLDVMNSGLECLRGLAKCWNSAKDQLNDSQRRLYGIHNIVSRPFKAPGGAWLGRQWGMKDPLEKEFKWEHDCIYADGVDGYSRIYFEALKEDGNQGRTPPSWSVRIA